MGDDMLKDSFFASPMRMTRSEFENHLKNNTLKIAFIGMSNIGKSFWSTSLAEEKGFEIYHVDDAIQEVLHLTDMREMAAWMGYPFQPQYEKNSKRYLEIEHKKTISANFSDEGNFVLDTTGSVIYLDTSVQEFLKKNFLVICFDVSTQMLKRMQELYFIEPKSIIWGEHYLPFPEEEPIDALRRCYPWLLKHRMKKYRELADVIIPGELSRMEGLELERFLEIIALSLPQS